MSRKFYGKRTHEKGQMSVQTGFKSGSLGEVMFKIPLPLVGSTTLTFQQAYDLADALDDALDQQETDPLI